MNEVHGDTNPRMPSATPTAVPDTTRPDEPLPRLPRHHHHPRMGTIQSATFNIWSTMVGGGSLSLPLAFTKAGNILVGPILLMVTAVLTEFCFGLLIDATYLMNDKCDQQQQGQHTPEQDQIRDHSPPSSSSSSSAVVVTAAADPILHDTDRNDVEDALLRTTPEPSSQPVVEDYEEDSNDDCGHYTLENITAAAATAMNSNDDQNDNDDTNTNRHANWAYSISALLVFFMCFFGIIGYCVLLRDMLLPVTKWIQQWFLHNPHHHTSMSSHVPDESTMTRSNRFTTTAAIADVANETTVTWANNLSMIIVVMIVTPLCTLQTLTSLQKFSTLSMCSVLILGLCIVYRSVQCHLGYYPTPTPDGSNTNHTTTTSFLDTLYDIATVEQDSEPSHRGFTWLPRNVKDVLDVIPLYISCYVCHYNIPVVYNDLAHPTPTRVRVWLHITVWGATLFYAIVGIAGSSFALVCGTHHQVVQGNVLLNFDPDDPLLLVGRLCLAVTIALAFPVLTIPARDIILRYMVSSSSSVSESSSRYLDANRNNTLTEPLLPSSSNGNGIEAEDEDLTVHTSNVVLPNHHAMDGTHEVSSSSSSTWMQRLLVSICVLWSGTSIASCVSSIDIVWDFLGSTLSIILSFLVPCGCYIILRRRYDTTTRNNTTDHSIDSERMIVRQFQSSYVGHWLPSISTFCWIIVSFFTPMMFISTANAIYNLLSSK